MRYEDYEVRPEAELFPLVDGDGFARLVEDIREHGLHEPIRQHPDGGILDGRNRLRACLAAGVEPRFVTWDGEGSATDYVISLNLHRRHLSQSQAAAVATKALPLYEKEAKERQRAAGGDKSQVGAVVEIVPQPLDQAKARDQAGEALGVSGRYVQDAKKLADEAPDLFEKVESGEMTLPAAKREAKRLKDAAVAERREKVKDLRAEGHTIDSIAAKLGVPMGTVGHDIEVAVHGKTLPPSRKSAQAEREVNSFLTTLAALHHVLPKIDIQALDWSLIEFDQADFTAHARAVNVFIREFRKEMDRRV